MKKRTAIQVKKDLRKIVDKYSKLQNILGGVQTDINDLVEEYGEMRQTKSAFIRAKNYPFSDYLSAIANVEEAIASCRNVLSILNPELKEYEKEYNKLRKEYKKMTGEKFNLITS